MGGGTKWPLSMSSLGPKLQPRVNVPQDGLKMLPPMSSLLKIKSVNENWLGRVGADKGKGSLHLH